MKCFFDGEKAKLLFKGNSNDASNAIEKLGQLYILQDSIKKFL